MPADRSDAACTVAGVRKPSMKEPAGNSRRWRRERRALWGFAQHGAAWGQPTPMGVLADDVAAPDWSVAGAGIRGTLGRLRLVRGLHRCHPSDQLTDPRDGLGLGAAGQQTAVPYPVESVRQDMHQEPPDELVRLERH